MKHLISLLCLGATLFLMQGCSSSGDDEAPLPGERISVLDLQKELTANVSAANIAVKIPEAVSNKEWPQAGGYTNHVMQNLSLGSADQLEKIWDSSIGRGKTSQFPLTSRPIVAAGFVYTLDTDHSVKAFHDQTGRLQWQADVSNPVEDETVISGGLAYDQNTLFVTNGYNDVIALNAQDGSELWRQKVKAPSRAAPTISNGRAYIVQMNNSVTALDAQTGDIIWENEGIEESTGLLGAASPAVDNNIVLAAQSSGDLTAIRAENGAILWTDNLAPINYYGGLSRISDIRGMPIIYGDLALAVSYGGKMAAFEKMGGNRVWQANISSAETPWIAGETIYTISADHQLIALSMYNGSILWIIDLPKYENEEKNKKPIQWMGPIMGGGRLILTATDGTVREYNPRNGEQLTQWSLKSSISLPPVLSAGSLFFVTDNGRIVAYR